METSSEEKRARNVAFNTTALIVAGGILITVAGFVVVPSLSRTCSNKLYKMSIKKDKIDIENLGPEIVRKDDKKTEE